MMRRNCVAHPALCHVAAIAAVLRLRSDDNGVYKTPPPLNVSGSGDYTNPQWSSMVGNVPLNPRPSGIPSKKATSSPMSTDRNANHFWPPEPGAVRGKTNHFGADNSESVYEKPTPDAYWEQTGNNRDRHSAKNVTGWNKLDNIKNPQFDSDAGMGERMPGGARTGPMGHRYYEYEREPPKEVVSLEGVLHSSAWKDHHPDLDPSSLTGKREGNIQFLQGTMANQHIDKAIRSLYKQILRGIPLIKHYYQVAMPLDQMRLAMRTRFYQNRFVRDTDAIRHLLHNGWVEFQDSIMMRRTKATLIKFFDQELSSEDFMEKYAKQEGEMLEAKRFWNGEEQRREGPHEGGHWSWIGHACEQEFDKLAGRVPRSWSSAKGYFETMKPDGTNFWEKNLDYEGWFIKNTDPDRLNARREMQGWNESGYNQPKHYASKNRRAWRRAVKDVEILLETPMEAMYTKNREQMFQYMLREVHPESNRISAERTLAQQDDDFYSTKFEEYEKYLKQAMREMPNPRLWKTDAFYFRLRYLITPLEYNWARVPVGAQQERLFNEWISDNANYAVYNSKQFEAIRVSKKQNPMANTFADFYTAFDPDAPNTRYLPWYHVDFDYDRRYKWDERCMRMKRWVQSGTVDGKNAFFDSYLAEWEQYVNRPELMRAPDSTERRYASPRMIQLYRALNKLMGVALAKQLRTYAGIPNDSQKSAEDIQKLLDKTDFSKFVFRVPVVIYPDGFKQPVLGLCGSPVESAAPAAADEEGAASSQATATA